MTEDWHAISSDGAYDRRAIAQDGRTLVESTCRFCGKRVVGSVYEGTLLVTEDRHRKECAKRKAAIAR